MLSATVEFTRLAARVGGVRAVTLYELSTTYPAAKTWYLSEADLNIDALASGVPASAHQGIVLESSGALGEAAIGGSGQGGLTLTLSDALGTYGSGGGRFRRFSDWFAEPVVGFPDPYDVDSLELLVKVAFEGLPDSDLLTVGRYRIVPGGKSLESGRLTLVFQEDVSLHRPLPRRKITKILWPNAKPEVIGRPVPLIFGRRVVPGLPVDPPVGKFLFGESPVTTPLKNIVSIIAVVADPDTGQNELRIVTSPASNPVLSFTGGTTGWTTLTENAQGLPLPATHLISKFRFRLRPKSGDPAPSGVITLHLEYQSGQLPGEQRVSTLATAEIQGATVTVDAWYDFVFTPPPLVLDGRTVWSVLRYQPDTGGGAIEVRGDSTGSFGYGVLTKGEAKVEFSRVTKTTIVYIDAGLGGDGFLVQPDLCGTQVFDYFDGAVSRGLFIGPSYRCNKNIICRTFVRIPIAALAASATSAKFRFFYEKKIDTPAGSVHLDEVSNFGTLDAGDWPLSGSTVRTDLGTVITPATQQGTWIEVNVLASYNQAKTDGLTHLCFRFLYTNEAELPGQRKEYILLSREHSINYSPQLHVTEIAGQDYHFEVHAATFTTSTTEVDLEGQNVGTVSFARDMGDLVIAADIRGLQDTTGGTYTGTPNKAINNGADMLRFLIFKPLCMNVPAARWDEDAFDVARKRLLDWPLLAGVIDEEADSSVWLARVAQCCKSVVFEDQAGKLTIFTDGRADSVLASVRPWEVGPVSLRPALSGEHDPPWSKVECHFDRDLLNLDNPEGRPPADAGWNGYAVISKDQTVPADANRQSQATVLESRLGLRVNGGGQGPNEENSFFFVGADPESDSVPLSFALRNWLWDRVAKRPSPWDLVEVSLPRFALGWRLMDEIRLESWMFPSGLARAELGEVRFAPLGTTVEIPRGTFRRYRCRRGLFSVRAIAVNAAHGPDWPARVTLQLIGWETA